MALMARFPACFAGRGSGGAQARLLVGESDDGGLEEVVEFC